MTSGKKKKSPTYKKPDAVRSKIMRSVKTKNTKPELIVRRVLREIGFHYRLHVKNLPGTPDIVSRKHKKAIFVNGCFWHGHSCSKGRLPKTNAEFWRDKIDKNINRDKKKEADLQSIEWKVLVLWQCELNDIVQLKKRLHKFLRSE
jgi:DNA mismatch endonuclease, patch repair protein